METRIQFNKTSFEGLIIFCFYVIIKLTKRKENKIMTGLVFENNKNIKVVKKGNVYSVEGFNKILNGIVELKAFACDGFEPEIKNLE